MNRVDRLIPLIEGKNPNRCMQILLNSLSPSQIIPQVDKYYVFVYKAKTKGIVYDKHPFVTCSSIFKWGFIGFNYHWNEYRRYSWNEIVSNLYEINELELNTMEEFPIAKFVRN